LNDCGTSSEFAEKYSYTALRFYMLALARELLPEDRINICWRYPVHAGQDVEIIYSDERKRARATNTMKCGQGWYCPLCSSYIAERRREELGRALLNARDAYAAVMITYTAAHNRQQSLRTLLSGIQSAYGKMRKGRAWMEIREEFAMVGSVRAVEITWGESGWHPHYHELLLVDIHHLADFYEGNIAEYADGLEAVLSKRWRDYLDREGLSASVEHGLRITTTNKDVAEYISKYGKMPLETDFRGQTDEMTRSYAKTPRGGNLSVWELLYQSATDKQCAVLFREFVAATRGRSQLQWSPGLKALLGIDEIRDEIACEGIATDTDRILATVSTSLWKYISNAGFMGQVMTYAHTGDADKLQNLLRKLERMMNQFVQKLPQFDDNW